MTQFTKNNSFTHHRTQRALFSRFALAHVKFSGGGKGGEQKTSVLQKLCTKLLRHSTIEKIGYNCRVFDAGIVHAVTAQLDINDVKIKLLDWPCAAWTIILTLSG